MPLLQDEEGKLKKKQCVVFFLGGFLHEVDLMLGVRKNGAGSARMTWSQEA